MDGRVGVLEGVMQNAWRGRLSEAVKRDGRSMRAISLAAGLSESYLYSVLKGGKEPTIMNLLAITDVLGITLTEIVHGYIISPESERLLKAWAKMPKDRRESLLDFLVGEDNQR